MDKIGILGGTFNPPHLGHLIIANEVMHALDLKEMWFMPNNEPPHKIKEPGPSDAQRVEMLELAIAGEPRFRVETIEMQRQGPSYTYDTIKLLSDLHPEVSFYFIVGSDMVEYLPKWHKIDELADMVRFVGVQRPNYSLATDYDILSVETPVLDLSSSLIRKRCRQGGSIRYLVPDEVRNYIEENGLYGS